MEVLRAVSHLGDAQALVVAEKFFLGTLEHLEGNAAQPAERLIARVGRHSGALPYGIGVEDDDDDDEDANARTPENLSPLRLSAARDANTF